MKKVTCPACNQETTVDAIPFNGGQWCQCQGCGKEFRQSPTSAGTMEIKSDGDAPPDATATVPTA